MVEIEDGWGTQTNAFFGGTERHHRRSQSAGNEHSIWTSTPSHTPSKSQAAVFLSSNKAPEQALINIPAAETAAMWNDDEEYYEWRASHPSSPHLSPADDYAPFRSDTCTMTVDTRQMIAEGRHSLLFPLREGYVSECVCKCAKGDREAEDSVQREIYVYQTYLLRCRGAMQPVATGRVWLRGVDRAAIILPRASGTLADSIAMPEPTSLATLLFTALDALHSIGIAHGDIKPHNIFLFPDRTLLFGDFGTAVHTERSVQRCVPAGSSASTACGSVPTASNSAPTTTAPGTLPYQAPEQIADSMPTPASDIYSLGVALYSILTQTQPFATHTGVRLMLAIEKQGFLACHSDLGMHADAQVRRVWPLIKECVGKDPLRRPTAREAIDYLLN